MTRRRGCEWTGGNPDKERVWAEAFAHLATSNLDKKCQTPHDGDLVRTTAVLPSPWSVAWLVGEVVGSAFTLREVGSERLCTFDNSGCYLIPDYRPLEGIQHKAEEVARKAMVWVCGRTYAYRFHSVTFPDRHARTGALHVRVAFGGPLPVFSVPLRATTRLTRASLIDAVMAKVDRHKAQMERLRATGWKPNVRDYQEPALEEA